MPTNTREFKRKEYAAHFKSLKNELKETQEPKECTLCGRTFKPLNKFQRFCKKCRAKAD